MNTTLQPIDELENLSEDQRDQLRDWLTELSIRKTMSKLRDEWSIIITYNKLQRYRQRLLAKDQVSEHLDHKMAMTEFLNLLNGNPVPYDEAGLALIQKRAFEAACAPKIAVSSLATLQRIFNYKNARSDIEFRKKIAERNTAVREAKLALDRARSPSPLGGDHNSRSERLVEGNTLVAGSGSHWAGVRGVPASDSVPCDHLGPLARNWEDVRRRAQIKFGITPEESARRAELRRIRRNSNSQSASAPALTQNPIPPSQTLNIVDFRKDLAQTVSFPPTEATSPTGSDQAHSSEGRTPSVPV